MTEIGQSRDDQHQGGQHARGLPALDHRAEVEQPQHIEKYVQDAEVNENGREQSPDFPVPNLRQILQPLDHTSLGDPLGNKHPKNRFLMLPETGNERRGHGNGNENSGQKAGATAEREKLAPIEEPFLSRLVGLLFLFPFLAGDADGLLIFRVPWISLILLQQHGRGGNLVFRLDPQFPRSVPGRFDSIADALRVKVVAELAGAGLGWQVSDHSHEPVWCR